MHKARVKKLRWPARRGWQVRLLDEDGVSWWLGWTETLAEAQFLARLLVDPREYVRLAQEAAWDAGRYSVLREQQEWIDHGERVTIPCPYGREEDQ